MWRMLRLMVMRVRAVFVSLALLLLLGCASGRPPEVGPVAYGVAYTVSAAEYNDTEAARRYKECTALPGATAEVEQQSLPPTRTLTFSGSKQQESALVDCLHALPIARVSAPFEVPGK
jgi:hypothetical protein